MDTHIPKTIITNVRYFADGALQEGAVAFCDGIITDISPTPPPLRGGTGEGALVFDGNGALLLPGAIDAHVHFREPGLTEKADIASESRAAAAGGVTYVMDMPNVKPTTTTLVALREKAALFREKCLVNYALFFGITTDNIDEALSIPQDEICGYKVFLGSSTGGMLMNDATLLRRLFASTKRVIAVHSESEDIIRANRERFANGFADLPVEMHPKIRSREACLQTTKMAIAIARETGANLHLCHLTTADELEYKIPNVTFEACVSHLWFTDADYARLGTKIKCNPAIKTAADREALRRGLTNGLIDTVATDHAPHLLKDKDGGALKAASGMPSIQFSYIAMLELVEQGILSLSDVVRLMCENPAKRFGITHRGKIAVGYAADLVLVEQKRHTITSADILSKCQWSPFEGETFRNKIKHTWVNGKRVY